MNDHWSNITYLMLCICLMHAQQPIAAWFGNISWKPKMKIAIAGGILYGISFILSIAQVHASLYINIIGPFIGLSSVLIGYALFKLGLTKQKISPDVFQIVCGIPQIIALIISWKML